MQSLEGCLSLEHPPYPSDQPRVWCLSVRGSVSALGQLSELEVEHGVSCPSLGGRPRLLDSSQGSDSAPASPLRLHLAGCLREGAADSLRLLLSFYINLKHSCGVTLCFVFGMLLSLWIKELGPGLWGRVGPSATGQSLFLGPPQCEVGIVSTTPGLGLPNLEGSSIVRYWSRLAVSVVQSKAHSGC